MTYREEMLRCLVGFKDRQTLVHAALGLAGEVGECVDIVKKAYIKKVEVDRTHLLEELGDVRWYLELALECLGSSVEEIEAINIDKLRKRYPDGFK